MKMRITVVVLGLAALAGIAAGPASVTITDATRTADGGVDIAGSVDFGEDGRQCAVADGDGLVTPFANADAAAAAGLDLVDACIERTETGLRFIWVMGSELPAGVPPEVVRYNWAFSAGDQTLQLQAKRTNVANATTAEDPVGHIQHAQQGDVGWFQVRGACTTAYLGTGISGCYHLDFVDGGIDAEKGEVWMDLPFDPKDDKGRSYAPDFTDGVTIIESASAGMSIAASGQAVVSNTYSSAYLNGWAQYCGADAARAGVGNANTSSSFVPLTLAADGSFSETLVGDGSHVHVNACSGFRYASAKRAIS